MRIVNVPVDRVPKRHIVLGRRGETETTHIVFDVSPLIALYGDGTAQLAAVRPEEDAPYPVAVTRDGSDVLWTVTNADTACVGCGACELFWYVGGALAKSVVYGTYVGRDIGDVGVEPPEAYETWVERVLAAGEAASAAASVITDMTAEVQTLPAGSSATASFEDGVLTLGIPRGNTGAAGAAGNSIWYTNDEITGDAEECGIGKSSIKGPSGKTIKPGDFVLGPEIGTSGDPNTLYIVQYFINTYTSWVVLKRVGSIKGDTGATGAAGTAGPGVPSGGTAGQFLVKQSAADYDADWVTVLSASGVSF